MPSQRGQIAVLGVFGHETVAWDTDNDASVQEAAREFNRLKGQGMLAFTTEGGAQRIDEFDSTASRIYFTPPTHGG